MISALASIDACAIIGDNTTIGDFTVIGKDVEIGKNCVIKAYVFIQGPTKIGNNNTIHQFSSIGDNPQDLSFSDEITTLEIGHNNVFREYFSVNRGTQNGLGITCIGNHNFFMTNVHIAHDCTVGNYNVITNNSALAGHCSMGDYIVLGGYTMVSQFVNIGSYVFSVMGSGINKNIPPFVYLSGNSAKTLGINKIGLDRQGFNALELAAIKKIYHIFFKQQCTLPLALEKIDNICDKLPKLQIFNQFIRKFSNHKLAIIRR